MNAYYAVGTLLRAETGILEEPIDEYFELQSYTLRALVMLGARHGYRDVLASEWRCISRTSSSEFFPQPKWEFFLWRAPHGELTSLFPEQTQSWAALERQAKELTGSKDLPTILEQFPEFALFIPLVYPHRFRSDPVAFLDQRIMN